MADVSKAQKLKLSNSRKRFKELQELRKNRNITHGVGEISTSFGDLTPFNSLTSSTHSSLNELIQGDSPQLNDPLLPKHVKDYSHTNKNSVSDTNNSNNNILSNVVSWPSAQNLKSEDSFKKHNVELNVDVNMDEAKLKRNKIFTTITDIDYGFTDKKSMNKVENDQTANAEVENVTTKEDCTNFHNQTKVEVWDCNIQSLRELSNQMSQMVESEYCAFNSITDLEKRNLELIACLEQEKITSEQQRSLMNELQMKVIQLEKELKEAQYSNIRVVSETDKLKEELQCHFQTIGLLVAEKAELSANLSQFELCSKQKSAECEELKARLKTSRSCVADLEREVNNLKSEKNLNKAVIKEQLKLIETLQQECSSLKEQKEELMQDMLEVREKLRSSSEEIIMLQQQIKELSSKLSLANIRIQQISNEELFEGDLEMIINEKFELERQIKELNQNLESIMKERDESSSLYQQYAQQQNTQLITITSRLEQMQLDNENLSLREQDRIRHISELERQLQNLQTDHIQFVVNKSNDLEVTKDLYMQLQSEKKSIEENYISIANEKEILLEELEVKKKLLSQMEDLVEQLRGNQPDSAKLLAMMESDKVAVAKAIEQNKQLKQQVDSMEEVFLKLNNDKVNLTERLTQEVNSNKDLQEKLQKNELQLQRLAGAIEIKDRELFHLQEKLAKLNQPVVRNEQVPDISHYETECTISVLDELKETQQVGMQLNEINISELLKGNVNEEKSLRQNSDVSCFRELNNTLETNSSDCLKDINQDGISNKKDLLDKEIVVRYLGEKVKRTMQEIADLMDEKQRLEHLVTQLQGETETIGEYITLYQQQRMILKQKCLERDQQLKQLAFDREQMKMKLETLIKLMGKLVFDKNTISDKQCLQFNNSFGDKYEAKNVHPEIVEEIVAILLEMKSSALIHSDENLHHCPWCSGHLITV